MRLFLQLLFIGFHFTFLACGGQKSSHTSVEFTDKKQALKVLEGDQVRCEGGSCPESVAALYVMHSFRKSGEGALFYKIGLCSATLIGPSQILTNRHCLEGIINEGDICHDGVVQMQVKFPALKSLPFETAKCRRVLKMSSKYNRSLVPDWAVIELERPIQRKQAVLAPVTSELDIPMSSPKVQMYPVYFDQSYRPILGVIKSVDCRMNFNHNLNIFSYAGDGPLFNVSECSSHIQKGNSGSGLFSADSGSLLGVMALGSLAGKKNEADGTSASCIPDLKNPDSQRCFFSEDEAYAQVAKTMSFSHHSWSQGVAAFVEQFPVSTYYHYRWGRDSRKLIERLRGIEVVWNAPWGDYSEYLKQKNASRLNRQFESSLMRVYFSKIPDCIVESEIKPKMPLPLINVNWSLIRSPKTDWREVKKPDGSFEVGNVSWNFINPQVLPIQVSTKREGESVKLEGVLMNSSEPLKSFSMKLPICK